MLTYFLTGSPAGHPRRPTAQPEEAFEQDGDVPGKDGQSCRNGGQALFHRERCVHSSISLTVLIITDAHTVASSRVGKAPSGSKTAAKAATKTKPKPAASKTKTAAKSTSKAAAKPAKTTTTTTTAKAPAGRKRKSDDEDDGQQPPIKKARAAPKKQAPPKVVINSAPTKKLDVFVFGEGSAGELGLGSTGNVIDVKRPRLNPHLPSSQVGLVQIAVGGMHVVALTHDNKIITWGVNDQCALGRDTSNDVDDPETGLKPRESTPTAVDMSAFPAGTVITQVAAGDSITLALTDEGLVYGCGTFRVSLHFDTIADHVLTISHRLTRVFWVSLLQLISRGPSL